MPTERAQELAFHFFHVISTHTYATIAGRKLLLTNPNKVLYPTTGFTKRQIVNYYTRISAVLLPHLIDRALTLKPDTAVITMSRKPGQGLHRLEPE